MVIIEKEPESYYTDCLDILNTRFDVWDSMFGKRIYKRLHKNFVLQYIFGYLLRFPIGEVEFNSAPPILTISGDVKTFMPVAEEIEKTVGIRVKILY